MNELHHEDDFGRKLRWLISLRIIFATLLPGSTLLFEFSRNTPPLAPSLVILYALMMAVFGLSCAYYLLLRRGGPSITQAYVQIIIDTFLVTALVFLTGPFASVYSFLYLVVIMYASMLLYRQGSLLIATLCSLQYGGLLGIAYGGFYTLFNPEATSGAIFSHNLWHLGFKLLITTCGCYAVALLSSILAEQARKSGKELQAMTDHVKRVEKMAAVGEMAAGLAHEIKNPLASLAGSIQLLRDDLRYDPDHDRLMQIILREADRLSSLVNNFLLFARPPLGKPESIELSEALSETVELFEKDCTHLGQIKINARLTPGVWIHMDPTHLRQVFWNLLLNAAEAIAGPGQIDIRLMPLREQLASLEIRDNGCGIPDDILQTIFNPFFTTKPKGTGLGLSIVYRIVDKYGYRLDVDSQLNMGTTFTLKFKRANPPALSLATASLA